MHGPVMLKRLHLHNYNCFVDFELELTSRMLLVGSNGSGKTSLWEAIQSLRAVIVQGAEVGRAFPTRSLTAWLLGEPVQRFALEVEAAGEQYRYSIEVLQDPVQGVASIQREHLMAGGLALYESWGDEVRLYGDTPTHEPRTRFPFGRNRSFLAELKGAEHRRALAFRDAIANFWLLAPAPQRLKASTAGEDAWLHPSGENFVSWLRGMVRQRPGLGEELTTALKAAIPGLEGIGFERISSKIRELMLTFKTAEKEYSLSAGELSDGQRSLLLLYGFVLGAMDRASLAFFDEPETGLAPHEMQPWMAAMSAALDRHGGQALVISHHPAIIDYLATARTVRFSRPGGGPARTDEITLETTGGTTVSEWLSRPWAYEDEHEERAA
jgi:predicted ATPase